MSLKRLTGFLSAACAVAALSFSTGAANAATFDGDYDVTYNTADPGLVIEMSPLTPLVNGLNFNLTAVGDVVSMDLFKIYTLETYVNNPLFFGCEDSCPKLIDVALAFTQPDVFGGSIPGTTAGESLFGGYLQRGKLVWNNGGTTDFAFGNGGVLRVTLTGGTFNEGVGDGFLGLQHWGLDPGDAESTTVRGTFELLSASVPEPATWAMMIIGFGGAGAMLRRNRQRLNDQLLQAA